MCNFCIPCSVICSTCTITELNCKSCNLTSPYPYLNPSLNTCNYYCGDGYFLNGTNCLSCDVTCLTCNLTSTSCHSCNITSS